MRGAGLAGGCGVRIPQTPLHLTSIVCSMAHFLSNTCKTTAVTYACVRNLAPEFTHQAHKTKTVVSSAANHRRVFACFRATDALCGYTNHSYSVIGNLIITIWFDSIHVCTCCSLGGEPCFPLLRSQPQTRHCIIEVPTWIDYNCLVLLK